MRHPDSASACKARKEGYRAEDKAAATSRSAIQKARSSSTKMLMPSSTMSQTDEEIADPSPTSSRALCSRRCSTPQDAVQEPPHDEALLQDDAPPRSHREQAHHPANKSISVAGGEAATKTSTEEHATSSKMVASLIPARPTLRRCFRSGDDPLLLSMNVPSEIKMAQITHKAQRGSGLWQRREAGARRATRLLPR